MRLGSKSFAMLGLLAACAPGGGRMEAAAVRDDTVRNVILMIADGGGIGHWSVAELAEGELAVAGMPVVGLVATRSGNSRVTDSAAGATALATGMRVANRTVSMGPDCPQPPDRGEEPRTVPACRPVESWFAAARRLGREVGIVTTTSVVDATPAAFVASSPSRYWADFLAERFADAGLTVLLGGGRRHFAADGRRDGRDLLAEMCARAACPSSAAELASYVPDGRPLIGLFAAEGLAAAGEREPSLPDMVRAALARLGRHPAGFVALLESEGADEVAHNNLPLARVAAEMLEFDQAVAVALDFARRTPGTLLIVTADHETGGLSLPIQDDTLTAAYSTGDHTGALVPLFAFGPASARFAGVQGNDEVGRMLASLVAP